MKTFLASYATGFAVFLLIDGIWLAVVAKNFYKKHLGYIMAENPNLIAAGLFYLLYILGITILIVLPSLSADRSLLNVWLISALFGLVAYATYDLTNLATLKDWPLLVTIVDLIWGTILTSSIATITFAIMKRVF